ncbi:helix-turn-helix transcriptional regulator [Nocardia sp. CDC160]|uniref:helix-turn-helix transcriptional regulator n=1 Tax=Nocardia sp. CDC160 TaxID=3112166 RepID=UPI002DB6EBA6|nr:helix-turn-helix transcriptional regulator [Nocardia sp. CDC160]MEC3913843.1 helix-turn-helix transcriptional regulator [Nocardia sp. CDC160]
MDGTGSGRELGAFLRAMRERLLPQDAGLPSVGTRRTPGLRRQEVAQLAAVSIDWYIRLEQGRVGTPGAAILDALADALRLTDAERAHLHLIARGAQPPSRRTGEPPASLRAILDGMPSLPAYLSDFRLDVLARNTAAAALFGPGFEPGVNAARLTLLDPGTRATQLDWERIARETVGNLRRNSARHPDDARLRAVIAELRTESPKFATWWDDHTVQDRSHGSKRIRHPQAGDLTVCYDNLTSPDGADHSLTVLTPADETSAAVLRTILTDHANRLGGTRLRPVAG